MIKWLVDSVYQIAPTKVEVITQSACFANVKFESGHGRRVKIENQLFDTFADAKDYMVAQSLHRLACAKKEVARAQEKHDALLALEEPHD